MNDYICKEKLIQGNSEPIFIKKAFELSNNNVFRIKNGTGFLCLIPFPDKLKRITILFTCNHVLSEEDIKSGKKLI